MNKVKVALVGAGNIANTHLEGYSKIPEEAEIYAICDINEKVLNRTADRFDIRRRYTDEDTMLRELPELDAVDVCVWNCNHAQCAIKALNAGKHVLCEKPMAYNAAQAQEMKECAEKNGKLLMIGFSMRFTDTCRVAKDFVDNGYLGEIYYSKAIYLRRHGAPGGWFTDIEKSGGGPIIDLGVHVIDLTRYLMGNPKPVSVYAAAFNKVGNRPNLKTFMGYHPEGATAGDPYTVEDSAVALIRYENGAVTQLETSYNMNGQNQGMRMIYGTKAGLDLTDGVKLFTEYNDYLADINITTDKESSSHSLEVAHFVDCIKNGTECRAKAEDGVIIMRILDAIYESAKSGHEVVFND